MINTTQKCRQAMLLALVGMTSGVYGAFTGGPSHLYACLLSYSDPSTGPQTTDTGTTIGSYEMASGTNPGYARTDFGIGSGNWTDATLADPSVVSNKNALTFPTINGPNFNCDYAAVCDAATAGTLLVYAPAILYGQSLLTVSSITVSSTTATVITSISHGMVAGNTAAVIGGNSGLDKLATVVTVPGAATFTYAVTGGTSNGSGSMYTWLFPIVTQGSTPQIPVGGFTISAQ